MNNVIPLKTKQNNDLQSQMTLLHDQSVTSNKRWVACMAAVANQQDRDAFHYLYEYFSPKMKTFFLQRGVTAGRAEELIQETFTTVWQKAHYYSSEKSYVSTWLYTIARNKKLDQDRKLGRHQNYVNEIYDDEPKLSLDDPHEISAMQQIKGFIQNLPTPQPEILLKVYFEGKAHRVVAEELNLTIGTVKGHIRNALDKLKNLTKEKTV